MHAKFWKFWALSIPSFLFLSIQNVLKNHNMTVAVSKEITSKFSVVLSSTLPDNIVTVKAMNRK